jgi:hypothetical protein
MLTEEQKILRRAAQKRYAEKHKEKVSFAIKKWNSENKEKMLEAAKKHYEKIKDNNEFKLLNSFKAKEWAKKNPHKVLEQSARKRATKLKRVPCWLTKQDFENIKQIYLEAKQLSDKEGKKYHVDHIIPLRGKYVSGLHVPENLRILLAEENMAKSNKFYIGQHHG